MRLAGRERKRERVGWLVGAVREEEGGKGRERVGKSRMRKEGREERDMERRREGEKEKRDIEKKISGLEKGETKGGGKRR